MSVRRICMAALFLGLPPVMLAADAMPSAAVTAAVADTSRPQADRDRDADRKPGEMVAFAGIKAGSKVAEIWPGGGYFTRIFSKGVGPQGVVYAMTPSPPPGAPAGRDMAAPIKALAAEQGYGNVKLASLDPAMPLPEKVDVVWTSLNYHDMRNRPNADMSAMNKMALDALKPGGVYVVIDHAAEKGSGTRDLAAMHRIDPDLVRQEVTSVGFEFAGESKALAHPDDTHKVPAHQVTRGKTDQFAYLFRKPAK